MLPAGILFVMYDVWMNRFGYCWFTHNWATRHDKKGIFIPPKYRKHT